MKSLGADVIFALAVGSIDDSTRQEFADSLSGFCATGLCLIDRHSRARKEYDWLSILASSYRLIWNARVRQFDKSYQVGYAYGKEILDRLKLEDSLPIPEETEEKRKPQQTMAPRRSSI
ncbi:unnamed protein product [Penicillium palitans]